MPEAQSENEIGKSISGNNSDRERQKYLTESLEIVAYGNITS